MWTLVVSPLSAQQDALRLMIVTVSIINASGLSVGTTAFHGPSSDAASTLRFRREGYGREGKDGPGV